MQLAKNFICVIDEINKIVFPVIAGLLGFISLILFIQVILRYIFHAPLVWSEEVAKYLCIWVVFLGMAIAMRKKMLIAVEALIQNVSSNISYLMRVLVLLLVIGFLAYLTYIGALVTVDAVGQNFASLDISMATAYAAVPVGSFLTLLNAIAVLIEVIGKAGDQS